MWFPDAPEGYESNKIKYLIPRYTRGRGLEIGCGTQKAYSHFIGIDNGHHFGKGAADIVAEGDDLRLFSDNSMDFVFSSHCLEHFEDMGKTLAEWVRVIKPGGYLVLYVPSANLYPKIGENGYNPDHKHDIYPGDLETLLRGIPCGFDQVECEERSEGYEYSLYEVYRKREDGNFTTRQAKKGKAACVVRFGGFGDMLQAASVFPRLREQGFSVTVMTTPKGKQIIEHDPFVDDWHILDTDQVPNHELTPFFEAQGKRYDRLVNLCESVEGTLLAMPGRTNHAWPQEVRHKRMNTNYMEFTADLAGVTFKPCRLFYPTPEEDAKAKETLGDGFTIVWALAGSSLHKFYPHMDQVIARVMLELPDARIFFTGDEACQLLEQGWEEEPRITRLSGKIGIRETLAMALNAQCVVGPETGVLNAVAYEKDVAKVIMLSHSSVNNLTKHWVKTASVTPKDTPCFPCHRLHYGTQFCPTDAATGAALCAKACDPEEVFQAIKKAYERR